MVRERRWRGERGREAYWLEYFDSDCIGIGIDLGWWCQSRTMHQLGLEQEGGGEGKIQKQPSGLGVGGSNLQQA